MLVPQMNGYDGQVAICNTKVLVVGAGGIGSSAILYLAGAGVGRLDIVDFDNVELCNLHRQIIHDSDSIGCNKAISACNRIHKLNPNVLCQAYQLRITYDNALDIISSYDIVVDATDNFEARYIINEACVELNRVLVSGSSGNH
jgi:adenylyltransferase/sulfurtransferase